MKYKLLILFMSIFSTTLQAQQQEVVANGGDYFQNTNGSLQWTVGEIVTESYTNDAGNLNQGFQQTTIVITEIPERISAEKEIIAFPNPANNIITLEFEKETNFKFIIYDINGKLVLIGTQKQTRLDIPIDQLTTGMYFLKIYENNLIIKTFKIEKI
ncbi:MAG: T9SS type A sorting domain-containing protein [Bacteroidales bacterium]|nr:T9SS type A sorting domain-containing protein [Bacteroidales bacterium]